MRFALGAKAPARFAAVLLTLLFALGAGGAALAQDREGRDAPEASWLQKIAWSRGPGLTRLRFHARWGLRPSVARTGPTRLRVDLRGVGAGDTPARVRVGSPEVESVQRVPESARGFLPPGVSERFLVVLTGEDVAWNVESTDDGFLLLLGDPELTGTPSALPDRDPAAPYLPEPGAPREVAPAPAERLDPVLPFRVGEDLPLRAGPSGLHPVIGSVRRGAVRAADGRRGSWVHLRTGGWIRHALGAASGRGTELRTRRTPVSWSVVTIVPVLNVTVEEVLPGRDPQAEVVTSYFKEPVRIARYTVLASGQSAFSFRFPPRADRLRLVMKSGERIGSLDPMAQPRRAGVRLDQLEESFPSPQISTGQGFSGWLIFPPEIDFLEVEEARIDVAGRIHLLFRVPGSGEMVEQ
jgi:hypothetical protein